jgi:YVTN family beta-propeller protein
MFQSGLLYTDSPLSNCVYVANRLSDRVTVIDGRTNRATER